MSEVVALSCQELVELVSDYLEDALSPDERVRFDEHLEVCRACRRYLEQIRKTIELTGSLGAESLTPEAEATLLAAFRDWKSG